VSTGCGENKRKEIRISREKDIREGSITRILFLYRIVIVRIRTI